MWAHAHVREKKSPWLIGLVDWRGEGKRERMGGGKANII